MTKMNLKGYAICSCLSLLLISCSPKTAGPNEKYTIDDILSNSSAPVASPIPVVSSPVIAPVITPAPTAPAPIPSIPVVTSDLSVPLGTLINGGRVIVSSNKNTYYNDFYKIYFDYPIDWKFVATPSATKASTLFRANSPVKGGKGPSFIAMNESSTYKELFSFLSQANGIKGLTERTSKNITVNGISGMIKEYSFSLVDSSKIYNYNDYAFVLTGVNGTVMISACWDSTGEDPSAKTIVGTIRKSF